jgi:biopolymer transport protein ExbB
VSLSRRRPWFAALLVLCCYGLGQVAIEIDPIGVCARGQARAQERGGTPASAADAAPEGPAATDGVPRVDASESFIQWMWRASGPIGVVIAAMSFYLIALVVWMAFQYRKAVAVPESLVREVSDLLVQKQFTDAYQRLSADRSFLARVLAAGIRKLPSGLAHAQRAMEMANDDVTMEMEHRTTYLATVGTLGPMIGLVGTVYGMILSFRVIATAGASPQASQLAAGISTALFATLEGIALSIPAIYFYALYRNRIARLSLEVSIAAESLLEQFSPGVRAPHPLAAAVTIPTARAASAALPPSEK